MKLILLLLSAFFCLNLTAQTTHFVSISGTSFSPNALTIEVGDSVAFTNASGGTHNVNGTQATFPSNPESFGNALGTSWVYGFKFTVEGTYDYRCDQHSGMMFGTITVVQTISIAENSTFSYSIFPNPSSGILNIKIDSKFLSNNKTISAIIYDITGKEVMRISTISSATTQTSIENLTSGIYFCSIKNGATLLATEKIIKF